MPTPTFTLNLDPHSSRHATRLLKKGKPWSKPRFGPVNWRKLARRAVVASVMGAFVVTATYFYGVGKVEGIKRAEAIAYEKRPTYISSIYDLQGLLCDGNWLCQLWEADKALYVARGSLGFEVQMDTKGLRLRHRHEDGGTFPLKAINDFNTRYRGASLQRLHSDYLDLRLDVVGSGGMIPATIHDNLETFYSLVESLNEWVAANKDSDWGADFAIQEFNMADLTTLLDRDKYHYQIMEDGGVLVTIDGNLILISPIKKLGLHFTLKFLDFGVLTAGHLNAWNEKKHWATLSRWASDAISLKRNIVVVGGVTENNIAANLAAFQVMVEELKELVKTVRENTRKKMEKT